MSYFISLREETDLRIDPTDFASVLNKQWKDNEVCLVANPESNHSVEWILHMNGRILEGSLDKTEQVVHMNGDIGDCAKFALWVRSQISSRYDLVFYDEGYSVDIDLHEKTTEQQLTKPFICSDHDST